MINYKGFNVEKINIFFTVLGKIGHLASSRTKNRLLSRAPTSHFFQFAFLFENITL